MANIVKIYNKYKACNKKCIYKGKCGFIFDKYNKSNIPYCGKCIYVNNKCFGCRGVSSESKSCMFRLKENY